MPGKSLVCSRIGVPELPPAGPDIEPGIAIKMAPCRKISTTPQPWQQLCENWAETIDESPIYADLLAQAFSGELSHLGIQGYCGETPACTRCPLQTSCRWNNGTVQGSEEEPLQVVIQKEKMDELSTATLAAWLFELSPEDTGILQSQLSDPKIGSANPLRVLELKTVSELGQILPKVKGFGEKLKALLELSKRYNEERLVPGDLFSCSRDIFQHFRFQLRDLKQEVFILVLLDNKHQYLSGKRNHQGNSQSKPGPSQGSLQRSHQKPGGSDCLRTQSPFRRSQSLGGRYSNHATPAGSGKNRWDTFVGSYHCRQRSSFQPGR